MPRNNVTEKILVTPQYSTYMRLKKQKRENPDAMDDAAAMTLKAYEQNPEKRQNKDVVPSLQAKIRYPRMWNIGNDADDAQGTLDRLGAFFARLNQSETVRKKRESGKLPPLVGSPAEVFRTAFMYFVLSGAAEQIAQEFGEHDLAHEIHVLKCNMKEPGFFACLKSDDETEESSEQ